MKKTLVALAIMALCVSCTNLALTHVPCTGISLSKTSAGITVGGTIQLTATVAPLNATNTNITWGTSNGNIATVTNGLVIGKTLGNATITATTSDGKYSISCDITVGYIAPPDWLIGTWMDSSKTLSYTITQSDIIDTSEATPSRYSETYSTHEITETISDTYYEVSVMNKLIRQCFSKVTIAKMTHELILNNMSWGKITYYKQ